MATPCIDARLSESRVAVLQATDGRTGASGNPTAGDIVGDRRRVSVARHKRHFAMVVFTFCRGLTLTP